MARFYFDNFFPSAQKAASSVTKTIDVDRYNSLRVLLDVTAVEGTSPTLDVMIQESPDGVRWFDHTAFAQATAACKKSLDVKGLSRYARASYTIGGSDTPKVTFQIDVSADEHV